MIGITNGKVIRIPIGDHWIDIKESIPFQVFQQFRKDSKNELLDGIIPLLKAAIIDWSFVNENNEKIPCTPENIEKMTSQTVMGIFGTVTSQYIINEDQKKNVTPSEPVLPEATEKATPVTPS